MIGKSLSMAVLAAALAACATASKDVQPAYVSPVGYQGYSCEQLRVEAQRVSQRAAQLAGVQDENRSSDAVMVGLAVVVAWPILFARTGDGATTAELSRLKGEMEAIEQASIQRSCGIVFEKAPPPEAPKPRQQQEALR